MAGTGVSSAYEIEPPSNYQIEAPDYEAQAAANPPLASASAGLPISPNRSATRRDIEAQPGVTTAQRASSPVYRDVMAGSLGAAAGVLAPEALPAIGGITGAATTGAVGGAAASTTSQAVRGENPVSAESLEQTGGAAALGALGGGLLKGAGKLLETGIFGDGLANYFADAGGGKFVPTDEANQIQKIHEAIGVKPGDMNIGLGATTAQDAYNLPGRAILKAGIKPQDLEGLTPFQQAEKLKPVWNKAGEAVAAAAQKATDAGVKFDGAKTLTSAIGDMLDPEGSKALALANDTAKQIGIKNWAKMTPNEAVELKQALWQRLPQRFRGPVYGALSKDLNKAVPEMIPVNRDYTELRSAMDAIQTKSEQYMSRATPTKFEQMLDLLKQHPAIAGATGLGGTVSGAMGLYQGGKAAYNFITKP
jgi:hypothetical protein